MFNGFLLLDSCQTATYNNNLYAKAIYFSFPYFNHLVICVLNRISSQLHCRCNIVDLMVEIDRILRPEGTVVVRDAPEVIDKVARIAHAVRWKPTIYDKEPDSHSREKIIVLTKTLWKL